jgi:hypothetical protein
VGLWGCSQMRLASGTESPPQCLAILSTRGLKIQRQREDELCSCSSFFFFFFGVDIGLWTCRCSTVWATFLQPYCPWLEGDISSPLSDWHLYLSPPGSQAFASGLNCGAILPACRQQSTGLLSVHNHESIANHNTSPYVLHTIFMLYFSGDSCLIQTPFPNNFTCAYTRVIRT